MDNEKIQELMEELGFDFTGGIGREPNPGQKAQFIALQKLIIGAIDDWLELRRSSEELEEWTEEWLVG